MAVFEDYEICSWSVGSNGGTIAFPVCAISESGGNRIVERNRPYRDGAKLDDIGSKAYRWTVDAVFENSIAEPGLPDGIVLYPTTLNELLDSFRTHGTGDLMLPTRGKVRARVESWSRTESEQDRDLAKLQVVFVEDNEDNVDAQSFQLPTVNASAKRVTETAEFDAQSEGMYSNDLADLRESGAQLQAAANAPGDTLQDLDNQAAIVTETANSVGRTFSRAPGTATDGSNLLTDPESSRTQRKLEQTKDMAGRSRSQSGAGRPRKVPYKVERGASIFAVAANINQPAKDLIDINPGIDPLFIPAGTVIQVFEAP